MSPRLLRPRRAHLAALLAIALPCTLATPAFAQEAPGGGDGRRQAVSIQPLYVDMGLWSAEYERAIGGPWTASFGAAYLSRRFFDYWQEGDGSDDQAVSTDAGLHLYVDRTPFRGLSLVVRGGAVTERGDEIDAQGSVTAWRVHPAAGFALDYTWTGGRIGRLLLGTGAGYRHVFVVDRDRTDRNAARDESGLTLRAAVGYRF